MLFMWTVLNLCHPNTNECAKGVEWKWCRLAAEEMWASTERYFRKYGRPLTSVSSFNYLRQVPAASYDDWSTVLGDLSKLRKKWDRSLSIFGLKGSNMWVLGKFFKAVVHVVFIFRSEKWVMTP